MVKRTLFVLAAAAMAIGAASPRAIAVPPLPPGGNWPGEELPLPLAVRTPQDLAVKALAERQYLIFNLLAGGKLAYDVGNVAAAAAKWEALLRLPGLDPDLDRVIRPLATDARARAGGAPVASLPPSTPPAPPAWPGPVRGDGDAESEGGDALGRSVPAAGTRMGRGVPVSGTVAGGGVLGPGGTVLWLKRLDAPTPRPAPARGKVIRQRNKTFLPRVLAVPVGSKIDFRNEDDVFHNVFSLSRPNDFDTGLYRQGASYTQVFRKAGAVQILCNIHATMIAHVFVVDTPYYTQADAAGAFTIKNVPPGEYELETWHEASAKPWKQNVTVGPDGVRGLAVKVAGDKTGPTQVPDKSGKPRQTHLGY
jgi:plastocyanin